MQFADIRDLPEGRVWTVVAAEDDEDGNWYAIPGIHVVSRLGYVVTEKPWDDATPQAVYYLDD